MAWRIASSFLKIIMLCWFENGNCLLLHFNRLAFFACSCECSGIALPRGGASDIFLFTGRENSFSLRLE